MSNENCINPKQVCIDKKLAFNKPTGDIRFANFNEILFIKAQRNYCSIKLLNGESGVICKPLKDIAKKLCHGRFARCHRSYMVNLSYITGVSKKENMICVANKYAIKSTKQFINDLIDEITI